MIIIVYMNYFPLLSLQDVHDCYLDLFQTHLHFVSNNTTGLTYQVSLHLSLQMSQHHGVVLIPYGSPVNQQC